MKKSRKKNWICLSPERRTNSLGKADEHNQCTEMEKGGGLFTDGSLRVSVFSIFLTETFCDTPRYTHTKIFDGLFPGHFYRTV